MSICIYLHISGSRRCGHIDGQGSGRSGLAVLGEEPVAPPGRGGVYYVGRRDVGHTGVSAEAGFGIGPEGFEHG